MTLSTTERDDHVSTLTINRPGMPNPVVEHWNGNAFTATRQALNDNGEVRCCAVTRAGGASALGDNLEAMQDVSVAFCGKGTQLRMAVSEQCLLCGVYHLRLNDLLLASVNGQAIGLGREVGVRFTAEMAHFGGSLVTLEPVLTTHSLVHLSVGRGEGGTAQIETGSASWVGK